MAAFGIGTNTNIRENNSDNVNGQMYHVACKTWFTATGSPRPLSFKFEGDDGIIQSVSNLNIIYTEDKNFAGVASKEYGCEAVIGGLRQSFKLIFYLEACKWVMVV